jgi:cytochrome oxidase Cu insertion factor (SCO1/SenC/PrrC family)
MKRMSRRKFIALLGWMLATVGPALLLRPFLPEPAAAQTTLPPEGSRVNFALTATDGMVITEQNYRGKWLVIYFGYTFCPDVCPTTLMGIAGALDALGPRAAAVQGLFITVDPRRDTQCRILWSRLKNFTTPVRPGHQRRALGNRVTGESEWCVIVPHPSAQTGYRRIVCFRLHSIWLWQTFHRGRRRK